MSHTRISSDQEQQIGIELFYTTSQGIGGRLRKIPDDFIVEELPLPHKALAPAQPPLEGARPKYTLAKVRAINWETNNLIREISRRLRIPRQHIYFAGTKDKRAITTQTMALKTSTANLENVEIQGVQFFDITTANNPLKMGDLLGNRFNIKISDIELEVEALKTTLEQTAEQLEHLNGFTNFFGVQRFGAVRPITHLFGKYLVKDDLESAVFTYLGNPMEGESPEAYEARAFIEKTHDFEEALKLFPKHLGFERTLIQYLIRQPTNYAGAIKRLPKNLQIMFVHAYQSYLFNKILSERVRRQLPLHEPVLGDFVLTIDKNGLPDHDNWIMVTEANQPKLTKRVAEGKAFISGVLFGAESEYAGREPGEIERGVIEAEGLGQRDFIIPELPALSSKGLRRELVAPLMKFGYQINKTKSGQEIDNVELKFELTKGCYATSLLREFIKADDLRAY